MAPHRRVMGKPVSSVATGTTPNSTQSRRSASALRALPPQWSHALYTSVTVRNTHCMWGGASPSKAAAPGIQPLPPWQPPPLRRPCDAGSPTGLPASPAQWPVDKITCPPPDHPCPIAHKHSPHTGSNSPTWPPRLSDLSVHPPRPAPSRGVSSHLPACMDAPCQASWGSPFLRAPRGPPWTLLQVTPQPRSPNTLPAFFSPQNLFLSNMLHSFFPLSSAPSPAIFIRFIHSTPASRTNPGTF